MVFVILAGLVFLILTAVALVRSQPMPRDMQEAEEWLDRRLQRERQILRDMRAQPLVYVPVAQRTTPDRYAEPFTLAVRQEIEQMVRGQA